VDIIDARAIREIVRGIYRAILRRDPDAGGAQRYERLIESKGITRALPDIISAFIKSSEYSRLQSDVLLRNYALESFSQHSVQLIDGRPVDHIASLGTHCLAGNILKSAGLKKYSLPFDWIFSSPQMLIDTLADDFAVLLDRQYYRSTTAQLGRPSAEHSRCLADYGLFVFNHRDPTREEDYQYLQRCVERFRRLLGSRETKLFVVIARPHHDLEAAFPRLVEALERRTGRFALLAVQLSGPQLEPAAGVVTRLGQIGANELYRFRPSSDEGVLAHFPDLLDEYMLLRLFYRFKISLKDEM
jgi:hypothetical protein